MYTSTYDKILGMYVNNAQKYTYKTGKNANNIKNIDIYLI